jgi:hypothetical protein
MLYLNALLLRHASTADAPKNTHHSMHAPASLMMVENHQTSLMQACKQLS